MTRAEKIELVKEVGEKLKDKPNIYVADTGGLTVEQVGNLRRMCFDAGIEMQVIKNTLLKKALDSSETEYDQLYEALKQQSAVFFVSEDINGPAKLIKNFRKNIGNKELVPLKGAFVDEAVVLGNDQLEALVNLKSKNELIADIVALLQSPMMNLLGQLNSGSNTISGVLKTLEEKGE
jgi:large subunit ribosomal protein L10